MAAAILSVNLTKCPHFAGIKCLNSFPHATTIEGIWRKFHPAPEKGTHMTAVGQTVEGKDGTALDDNLTVGDISGFNIKYLNFECTCDMELEEAKIVVQQTTKKAENAFEVLMARGRDFPDNKQRVVTRKDELYNDIVNDFKERSLDFPRQIANTEGSHMLQKLTSVLWYLTNQHHTINNAASKHKEVFPIPHCFSKYEGYNEVKRKKLKSMPLDSSGLDAHSQVLYGILMKPVINSTPEWQRFGEEVKQLADCMVAYREYLKIRAETTSSNQSLPNPVRTIGKDATIEHRKPCNIFALKKEYKILDRIIKDTSSPVVFDETLHVETPFETNKQRFTFVQNLHLTVPIDIVRFSPGGSIVTTLCIQRVAEGRSDAQLLVEGAKLLQTVRPHLLERHTRAQRKLFKKKLSNLVTVSPAVSEFIYRELAMDGSPHRNPITEERLRLISLGHSGLVTDLRYLNPGRPNNRFDCFFEKMASIVEEVTAADDRRHGEAHLSEFISLNEMIEKTKQECPEGTAIPSSSLVRLQFVPRNPYSHAALNFTSKLQVQYKIQRRQLRLGHVDAHFCNAQFRYMKERAVELQGHCMVVCCDDKAKVPVGEPGAFVSTGVRGRTSIVPAATTLVALDHDMVKSSLTPSVILNCKIPESMDKSFVNGTVTTCVNDSVFQSASPFRHASMLAKVCSTISEQGGTVPPVLMKFTDGGTDQRNTLESVKCANICIFKEFNFDLLIHLRCAPGQSWVNPAERIMSILNLGLQNVSLQRAKGNENTEAILKQCGSMSDIRSKVELKPDWLELVEPVQSVIRNRFSRLKLKTEPIKTADPSTDVEIDLIQRHLRELFPDLDLTKLKKATTRKNVSYQQWLTNHCRKTQYSFQIRKCEDRSCCLEPKLPAEKLFWLPDPVVDDSNVGHYKAYSAVKGLDTTEADRPSLKIGANKNLKPTEYASTQQVDARAIANTAAESVNNEDQAAEVPTFDPTICSVQNARSVVVCVECEKPRIVYSRHRLTDRQQMSLMLAISDDYEYTCGSVLLPPSNPHHKTILCRPKICCETPIQLPYYASGLGKSDLCCYCASEDGEVDQLLKAKYRTVLPLCASCKENGKNPVVQRPYGIKKR